MGGAIRTAKRLSYTQAIDCTMAAHESDMYTLDRRWQTQRLHYLNVHARCPEPGTRDRYEMCDLRWRDVASCKRRTYRTLGERTGLLAIISHAEFRSRPMPTIAVARRNGRPRLRTIRQIRGKTRWHDHVSRFNAGPAIDRRYQACLLVIRATDLDRQLGRFILSHSIAG